MSDPLDEKLFIEDDPRSKVLKEMTDEKELDAAMELIEEQYDPEKKSEEPEKDTSSDESEPKNTSDEGEDTSDKSTEKTEKDEEEPSNDKKPEVKDEPEEKPEKETSDDEFKIDDEFIKEQPEENRKLFETFKGKSKADLAKATANAVALKNPFIKDNNEAIDAVAKKLESYTDDELISTFVDAKREAGKHEQPERKDSKEVETDKIELPTLPENDPKVKENLSKEVAKRLKKTYPDMPEDMDSEDYKEWERDLQDEGLRKSEKFLTDLRQTENSVKGELQKVVYAHSNLKNLYNEDPSEILPMLNDENLPRLKHLNDNYKDVNNKALQGEVELIKEQLGKYDLTLDDLGVDLSLQPDDSGVYYSEPLSPLMLKNGRPDPDIVGRLGKVPILKKGELAKRFIYENNPLILTKLAQAKTRKENLETERLRDENLNTLGGSNSGKQAAEGISPEKIRQTTDDDQLDKVLDSIEGKYD